jgi:uncharacterized protein YecE (DUF72 family)
LSRRGHELQARGTNHFEQEVVERLRAGETPAVQEERKQLPTFGIVRIGISGWTYAPWRGTFFPAKLPQHRELGHAANIFSSIEINGTFYSLQRPESYAKWAAETPPDFVFSVKGPRFITHIRRLKDARAPLANFLASGLLRLGPKLGPILWQLPPNFKFDSQRIETFLKLLPRDTESAVALSRRHDKRVSGRAWMKTDAHRPLRHAMEIRHTSFAVPEFIELLRAHNVALVCADTVEWPRLMDVTSDFVYCRLHGSEELYASGYDAASLDAWATRVGAWARGDEPDDAERVIKSRASQKASRDVFVYFDNDAKVRAPVDAQGLIVRVEKLPKQSAQRVKTK